MSDDLLAQCKRLAQKRFDEGAVVSPVIVLTTVDIAERERAILTDLIAELRDAGRDQAMEESVIDLTELADTYERRLREVQGE